MKSGVKKNAWFLFSGFGSSTNDKQRSKQKRVIVQKSKALKIKPRVKKNVIFSSTEDGNYPERVC